MSGDALRAWRLHWWRGYAWGLLVGTLIGTAAVCVVLRWR